MADFGLGSRGNLRESDPQITQIAQIADRAFSLWCLVHALEQAMKLYELGRLTSGQASSHAGIPRVTFLLSCERYGTPSVTWDRDELDAAFDGACS